jgi:hypothetical protein
MEENEMTGLLIKLAEYGITGIKVHYDGGGDSGCIEDIVYTTDKDIDIEGVLSLSTWAPDVLNLKDLNTILYNKIYDFVEEKILNDIEDWWNNDGGYGDMGILVPSGGYWIQNNIRITDIETHEHDGNLINKTLE